MDTDPPFPVEFEADCIEILTAESVGNWRLKRPFPQLVSQITQVIIKCKYSYATLSMQISRTFVDGFGVHQIPYSQIRVSGAKAEVGSELDERVSLKGAKEPNNFFTLQCGPTTADPGIYI